MPLPSRPQDVDVSTSKSDDADQSGADPDAWQIDAAASAVAAVDTGDTCVGGGDGGGDADHINSLDGNEEMGGRTS